jgi:hypothetical protein
MKENKWEGQKEKEAQTTKKKEKKTYCREGELGFFWGGGGGSKILPKSGIKKKSKIT